MINTLHHLPTGLLERDARHLHEVLPGPTLLCLPGRRPDPLFVCVLLHGNETSGWEAMRALLRESAGRPLPRGLALLVGNVAAAREGVRHLAGQPDFNRIWRGEGAPEHAMAREVVERVAALAPFAALDIHNNSGRNPHYSCVPELEPRSLQLARLFGRLAIHFRTPDTVLALALAPLCPTVAVECGRPDEPAGATHARELVEACLRLDHWPVDPPAARDLDLYRTVARVVVPEGVNLALAGGPPDPGPEEDVDLVLPADLDLRNFRELPAGTVLGRVRPGAGVPVVALDGEGHDVTARYLRAVEGRLLTTRMVMPSMLSLDLEILQQDCLCYLMERLPWPELRSAPALADAPA